MKIIQTIKNKISAKYYTYIPGEFMPVFEGTELRNRKEFHIYKAKRMIYLIKNYKLVVYHWTHKSSYTS